MTRGTPSRLVLLLAPSLALAAACSSSSSSGTAVTVTSATQDLTADPDGQTTVVVFGAALPAGVLAANFEASGGQSAVSAMVAGDTATVTWDARVTPSHQVRLVGVGGFASAFSAVATSDASAPTFTTVGTQNAGPLGSDTLVVQFAGPRVAEDVAEDPANWRLSVGGTALDLTSAVLTLDVNTQQLSFDLPPSANLHAVYQLSALSVRSVADVALATANVAGAAAGDAVAPTLVGGAAVQNLGQSEYGLVVDFTFSEPMDPVFAARTANFSPGFPVFATSVTQVSDEVLRVSFTGPIIPGLDTVTLTGVVDAHGNAFAGGAVAVTAGSTVANAFAASPALSTVQNQGGDNLVATFVQALAPDEAEDPARWSLVVDGNPVDLTLQSLSYDFVAKSLTVSLVSDFRNGDAFTFEPAMGNAPRDVDGQAFAATFTGAVAGETTLPAISKVEQNRSEDPTGRTLDVTLTEDVDPTAAQMTGSWGVTGGLTVTSATLQPNKEVVRLVLDGLAVPGDVTLSASAVEDLAGNAMAAVSGVAVGATDTVPPVVSTPSARAVQGTDNDTLSVSFSDDMVASEVLDSANWTFESPVGTSFDESTATITYDASGRTATMTFGVATGFDFKSGDDFAVALTGMRDIAGNALTASILTGDVEAESEPPSLEAVFLDGAFANQVHVRLDEPCDELDDVFDATLNPTGLTSYTVRTSGGLVRGTPLSVSVDADEMGATLTFGFVVAAGSDTLDVRGVTDLAGNPLFPVDTHAIATEETGTPSLAVAMSSFAVLSGEENDSVEVVFDRAMSRWRLLDPANYSLELMATPVDLTTSTFAFDGDRTVTITLDGAGAPGLRTASSYDLAVSGVASAQGVAMVGTSSGSISSSMGSDATAPALAAGSVRLDPSSPTTRVIVRLDEAIDAVDAVDTSLVTLDAVNPMLSESVGPRAVRSTFATASVGQTLSVTYRDLAGNSGLVSLAVLAADAVGPLVASMVGTAVPGFGGDVVEVAFDEPVDPSNALSLANYQLLQGGAPLSMAGATARFVSGANTVRILLGAGSDLDAALPLRVVVANVTDLAGNAISPSGDVTSAVVGDLTAPALSGAFPNLRAGAGAATVVDVVFGEEVDPAVPGAPGSWTVSGGQTVTAVTQLRPDRFRLTLSAPLVQGQTLSITAVTDPAGNASGALMTTPVF